MQTSHAWKCALTGLFASCLAISPVTQAQQTRPNGLPPWAYNIPDKDQPPATPLTGTVHVPGSGKEYSAAEAASNTPPPDWFPDEHGPAPRIVTGQVSGAQSCGSCHLMTGQGHAESADISDLPVEYFIRQMVYFRTGARKDDGRMAAFAKAASDEDIKQAAEYFATIKPIPVVKVVETKNPPKTYVSSAARHRIISPGGGTEPIGHRIVEIPDDPARTAARDPHTGFTAYVPPGSIARGERLVKTGASGKTVACAICHGDDLRGLGEVPRIAGLQPVYIARQLISIQNGSSAGKAVELMKKPVAILSEDDIIAISAYLGTLPPK
jgi:cytochrome c553